MPYTHTYILTNLQCSVLQRERLQGHHTLPILLQNSPQALLGRQLQHQTHIGGSPHTTQLGHILVVEIREERYFLSDLFVSIDEVVWFLGEGQELADGLGAHEVRAVLLVKEDFNCYVLLVAKLCGEGGREGGRDGGMEGRGGRETGKRGICTQTSKIYNSMYLRFECALKYFAIISGY